MNDDFGRAGAGLDAALDIENPCWRQRTNYLDPRSRLDMSVVPRNWLVVSLLVAAGSHTLGTHGGVGGAELRGSPLSRSQRLCAMAPNAKCAMSAILATIGES